jgi:hypothetical protein
MSKILWFKIWLENKSLDAVARNLSKKSEQQSFYLKTIAQEAGCCLSM